MSHLTRRILVAASLVVAAPASAGPKTKAKAPPPPVPQFWIGSFWSDGDMSTGKPADGKVTVNAADAPADAILVTSLDPPYAITPATGEAGKDGTTYKATYTTPPDMLTSAPAVIVVPAGTKPVVIKVKASVKTKLLKQAAKEFEEPEIRGFDLVGFVDLDSDAVADVALIFGCLGGEDGVCATNTTFPYVRDGKGWKSLPAVQ